MSFCTISLKGIDEAKYQHNSYGGVRAKKLGEVWNLTPKDANMRLVELGLQVKDDNGDWELTEIGKNFGHYWYHEGKHRHIIWKERLASDAEETIKHITHIRDGLHKILNKIPEDDDWGRKELRDTVQRLDVFLNGRGTGFFKVTRYGL